MPPSNSRRPISACLTLPFGIDRQLLPHHRALSRIAIAPSRHLIPVRQVHALHSWVADHTNSATQGLCPLAPGHAASPSSQATKRHWNLRSTARLLLSHKERMGKPTRRRTNRVQRLIRVPLSSLTQVEYHAFESGGCLGDSPMPQQWSRPRAKPPAQAFLVAVLSVQDCEGLSERGPSVVRELFD